MCPYHAQILVVCGARKGFRFNSQDITAFRTLSEQLAAQFELLDQMFQALSLDVKLYKFADLKRIEDDAQFFRHVSTTNCVTTEVPPELWTQSKNEEHTDAAIRWRAMVFQWRARQYIDSFSRLRETILGIRERLQQYNSSRKPLIETKDLGDAGTVQAVLSSAYV